MIVIDMPMPQRCAQCPCIYLIMTGSRAGRTMCCAMEARGDRYVLVDEYEAKRPENCPIKMEIIK